MLRTDELDFDLPEELIATAPADPRDSARLLVVSRSDPGRLEHRTVRELPGLLVHGDCLVFNTTRVLPARFVGTNLDTRGRVQGLYLRDGFEPGTWVVLLKMRRHREGARLRLKHGGAHTDLELLGPADEEGAWLVRVIGDGPEALARVGLPPLPPYILAARKRQGEPADRAGDAERYQTVYAREPGSVAAPTAGLHFTPELLAALTDRGVTRENVTLHVGRGTFAPVETDTIEAHPMHSERCAVAPGAIERLRAVRESGGRVIPVGSTSCRAIESFAVHPGATELDTDLLIAPGYEWRLTDGLLTNFHLPRSTLLAMVAALLPGGAARLREIYAEAVRERYRFFSFGDAMLVLP